MLVRLRDFRQLSSSDSLKLFFSSPLPETSSVKLQVKYNFVQIKTLSEDLNWLLLEQSGLGGRMQSGHVRERERGRLGSQYLLITIT